jgi:mono/diheme cytochrome c family protein
MRQLVAIVTFLLATAEGLLVTAEGYAQDLPTTMHGVFTTTQAAHGAELNEEYCAGCHEDGYFQDAFLAAWRDQPASGLFNLLRATMPQDSPGLLTDSEYADVLAYIFALNGLPDGQSQLDPHTLDRVIIATP